MSQRRSIQPLRRAVHSLLFAAGSATCLIPAAFAQDSRTGPDDDKVMDEVIVTARFREESLQNVGQSITAFSTEAIESAGISSFEDLALRTPGLAFSNLGPNRNTPRIRGISNAVYINDLQSQPSLVSNFVNDIPVTSIGFNQLDVNAFDLERVEILRGPQGTLFGEGSAGGAIRYFAQRPKLGSFDGKTELSFSDTSGGGSNYSAAAAVNIPVGERFAARLTGYRRDDDGFIDNITTGADDDNSYTATGGRVNLLWQATDALSINLFAIGEDGRIGSEYIVDSPGDELITSRPAPDGRDDDYRLYGLNVSYDFGPATLTSITGRFERDFGHDFYDATFTNVLGLLTDTDGPFGSLLLPGYGAPGGVPGIVVTDQVLASENFTQELRLVSKLGGRFEYTVGAFYKDGDFINVQPVRAAGLVEAGGASDLLILTREQLNNEQYSVFGEVQFDLTPQLRLIGGLRYFNDTIESDLLDEITIWITATGETLHSETEISEVLPRLGLEYRPAADLLLYANVSRGARNGGLNSPVTASFFPTPEEQAEALTFDKDEVTAYEVGVKSTLAQRLVVNASLYYNDFADIQVLLREAASGFGYFENGPDARILGAELAMTWRASDNWDLFLRAARIDTDFRQTIVTGAAPLDIQKGDRLPFVPDYSFNVGTQATYPVGDGNIVGRLDFMKTASQVGNVETQAELGGYHRLDLRLGYERDNWSATLFAENLTNEISVVGETPTATYITRPRVIGVMMRYNW